MKVKLTDAFLEKRKGAKGRIEVFDSVMPGFGVRMSSREARFFMIRRVNGQKKRISLGRYPDVSLADARADAAVTLAKIRKGTFESGGETRQPAGGETFKDAAEAFIREYALGKKTPLRPQTVKGYRWALQGEPTAGWHERLLRDVADTDVMLAIKRLEAEKKFASARLLKAYLRKFFAWAKAEKRIDLNPAADVPLNSEPSDFTRNRVLSLDELRVVLTASSSTGQIFDAFVKVLAVTGQRRQETAMMRWDGLDLDGEKPVWRIPAEVTKNRRAHDVPLSPEVVAILRSLPRLSPSGIDCPFVFSTDGKSPISGFSKFKAKLDAAISAQRKSRGNLSAIPHWTLHDLRRTVATRLGDMGVMPHVVEAVLNHISGAKKGVAGIYNYATYDEERRKALTSWASQLLPSHRCDLSVHTGTLQNEA